MGSRCDVDSRGTKALHAAVLVTLFFHPFSLAVADEPNEMVIHVISRLSFGPRPGDIARVKAMGIPAYIEEQLHPERISDSGVSLNKYGALAMGLEQLIEEFQPVSINGIRGRAAIFEKRALADQANDAAAAQRGPPASRARARREAIEDRETDNQIMAAKIIRAVYSERQLYEMMVDFWMNHFNIQFGDNPFAINFEQQVIRPNTMGKFEELLMAVARHPSMLAYLDNWLSSAPAEEIQRRLAELKPTLNDKQYVALMARKPFLEKVKGLNENYARELMELHTVGIDGGYTQEDIIEVAKVLTGWTIVPGGDGTPSSSNGREEEGVFAFDPLLHIQGAKTVLGQTIPSGGVEEGEQVLRMLAHHPATASFISTKLVRRFVADDPPAEVVAVASDAFMRHHGDIREVLRAIFDSPQFRSTDYSQAKIKKPLEFVVSTLRAVNAQVDNKSGMESLVSLLIGGVRNSYAAQMGEQVYNFETPDGNPDVAAAWVNTNALLKRLEFVNGLVVNQFAVPGRRNNTRIAEVPGLKVDLASAETLLKNLGISQPTAEQISKNQELVKQAVAEREKTMKKTRMAGRRGQPAVPPKLKIPSPHATVVSTMLGSPRFQKR